MKRGELLNNHICEEEKIQTVETVNFHFSHYKVLWKLYVAIAARVLILPEQETIEPCCEKTSLLGFRPGPTQTGLYSHRR